MNNEKYKQNFDLIFNEIKRQFEIEKDTFDKLDIKAQFILGGVLAFGGYLITRNDILFLPCFISIYLKIFYYLGFILMFIAGYNAYCCFKGKNFKLGIKLDQLIRQYKENSDRDFKKKIGRMIFEAKKANNKVLAKKAAFFEKSFDYLIIGIFLLVISKWFIILFYGGF